MAEDSATRFGRRPLVGFLCLGLGALLVYGIWFQLYRDEEPLAFDSLTEVESSTRLPVAEGQDGYQWLVKELELREWPEVTKKQREILAGRGAYDAEVLMPLIQAAPEMRELLAAALAKPHKENRREVYRERLNAADLMRNLLLAEAEAFHAEGNHESALENVEILNRSLRRIYEQSDTWGGLLIKMGNLAIMEAALWRSLAEWKMPEASLAASMEILKTRGWTGADLRRVINQDVGVIIKSLGKDDSLRWVANTGRFAEPDLPDWYVKSRKLPDWYVRNRFKPNATQNRLIHFLRELEQMVAREVLSGWSALEEFQKRLEAEKNLELWSFEPNRVGRSFAATAFFCNFSFLRQLTREEARRRCRMAVLAAKRYSLNREGRWPETLAELVPEYLPEVPLDPYNGQTLRWVASKHLAFVIGEDGTASEPVPKAGQWSSSAPEGAWAMLP